MLASDVDVAFLSEGGLTVVPSFTDSRINELLCPWPIERTAPFIMFRRFLYKVRTRVPPELAMACKLQSGLPPSFLWCFERHQLVAANTPAVSIASGAATPPSTASLSALLLRFSINISFLCCNILSCRSSTPFIQ